MTLGSAISGMANSTLELVWPILIGIGNFTNFLLLLVIDNTFYVMLAYGAYKLSLRIYAYYLTLVVQGEPNQWVVVMRDGRFVKAGIGLSLVKMPFQEVAIFPSQIRKVDFSTEQITSEMQGIKVSATISWTIYRENDGPMRAYKYLGDLNTSSEANKTIISLASSVVRNEIANTTIREVLKNRDYLRKQIRTSLTDIFKGWGIWLETIEITNVKISSGSLFTNLQTEFRELQNQAALKFRLEMEHTHAKNVAQNNYDLAIKKCDLQKQLDIDDAKRRKEKARFDLGVKKLELDQDLKTI